ncbi:MAG: GNAT family N-acetyltransferase [Alphaproteobacteria bacterium]|nr:GNAT family N-acetyltransferase [Alphaproteobacteria bacterium]
MDSISLRILTPEDFEIFRSVRLKALADNMDFFRGNLEANIERPDSDWQNILDGNDQQILGLFDSGYLIGISGVFTWDEDSSGETGILAMSYIDPAYRRRNYSSLFFKARIDFAVKHLPWNCLAVTHRRGNESARHAILRHGFTLFKTRQTDWSDGTRDKEYMYLMDLESLRDNMS